MKRKLIVRVSSGLMSRCYSMAEAHRLAKKYNRELIVLWMREFDCPCDYEDLFDIEQFDDIESKFVNLKYHVKWPDSLIGRIKFLRSGVYYRLVEKKYQKDCKVYFQGRKRQKVKNLTEFDENLLSDSNDYYIDCYNMGTASTDLSVLKFRQELYMEASSVLGKDEYIGIHIRRREYTQRIMTAKIDFFVKRLDAQIAQNKNVKFYIASNDASVKEIFSALYPGKVKKSGGELLQWDTLEGLRAAVVDVICLSKCKAIIGSNGSAFGGFAAQLGNIPISYIGSDMCEIRKVVDEGNFVWYDAHLLCPEGYEMDKCPDEVGFHYNINRIDACDNCSRPCALKVKDTLSFFAGEGVKEMTATLCYDSNLNA